MLHGFPESSYSWRRQIAFFSTEYFVAALNMRGYYKSDRPTELAAYKLDVAADDVALLIDHLGYKEANLMGRDFGGAIAWVVANNHACKIRKLVIVNVYHVAIILEGIASKE